MLTRQKVDHARLDRLLDLLPAVTGEEQQELLNRICRLVFSHAFAEEAVLWPVLRRALPDGEELTTRVELEHQEITELMAGLERSRPGDPDRPTLLERSVVVLRHDVRDEEDVLLPRLQDAVSTTTLRRLGVAWELVRRAAPTRAHPLVARRPPGNAVAAVPLSLIDRTRDGLDYAGRRSHATTGRVLRVASRRLADLAGHVERVRLTQRGERLETHVGTHGQP